MGATATSSSERKDYDSHAIGVAFAITILAGMATAVGGAIVFFPALSKKFNPRLLSGGLGVAAGAITYLTFVDIFPESIEFFAADAATEQEENLSSTWTTLCFFSGIVIMCLLDFVTHKLSPRGHSHDLPVVEKGDEQDVTSSTKIIVVEPVETAVVKGDEPDSTMPTKESEDQETPVPTDLEVAAAAPGSGSMNDDDEEPSHPSSPLLSTHEKTSLWRSGLSTAVALILHNVPEGLITFVGAANDPAVGAALAIGIALHNMPEGSSIALPIYFATGNKCKAFLVTVVAALAPILGGLIAYSILGSGGFSNTAFAVLHGLAGGMLIYIAINNLMSTAYKYDTENKVATFAFVMGMALMSLALVILDATGNHDHAEHGSSHHGHGATTSIMEELVATDDFPMASSMNHGRHDGHDHAHY